MEQKETLNIRKLWTFYRCGNCNSEQWEQETISYVECMVQDSVCILHSACLGQEPYLYCTLKWSSMSVRLKDTLVLRPIGLYEGFYHQCLTDVSNRFFLDLSAHKLQILAMQKEMVPLVKTKPLGLTIAYNLETNSKR